MPAWDWEVTDGAAQHHSPVPDPETVDVDSAVISQENNSPLDQDLKCA